MHRQISVKMRSCDGEIYVRQARMPFSIPGKEFSPTQEHKDEFQNSLKTVLAAQWKGRYSGHMPISCALPLLEASFHMLNLKIACIHLSNDSLRQGGMDLVPAEQGLMELPEDLECIKTDIQELSVYSSALQSLPHWLGNMVNLQVLVLDGGNNAGTGVNDFLQQIPSNMAGLVQLTHFTLKNFSKLSVIPQNMLELPCLESIVISGCISLSLRNSTSCHARTAQSRALNSFTLNNTLDSGLECLTNFPDLHDLSLRWLPNVNYLPLSLSALGFLQSLNLEYVPCRRLPLEMSNLTRLTSLGISHCSLFEFDLTDSVVPTSLTKLNLRFLPLVKELPITIGNLTNLRELMIERCNLETIPPEICKLTILVSLHLLNILAQEFPRSIDSLVNLKILHCTSRSQQSVFVKNSFFVQLALVLPSLLKLQCVFLMSPQHDEVLAIGRSLKAWPLALLDTSHMHLGFRKHWKILALPKEAAQWDDQIILQYWKVQQEKVIAFVCGSHQHLGQSSWISVLNHGIIQAIANQICGYSDILR